MVDSGAGQRSWRCLVAGIAATYFLTRWWLDGARRVFRSKAAPDRCLSRFDRKTGSCSLIFRILTGEPTVWMVRSRPLHSASVSSKLDSTPTSDAKLPGARVPCLRMERDADTPVDREVGIEIGQREGARALVVGAIGRVGETYSVTAEMIDPQSGVATSRASSAPTIGTIFSQRSRTSRKRSEPFSASRVTPSRKPSRWRR